MKSLLYFFITSLLALTLGGCSSKAKSNGEEAVNEAYTAAAMTIEAQITPTADPATATLMMTSSPLATATMSTPLATATQQSLVSSYSSECDSSAYVSDVTIPDGTELYPSQTFTKTWLLKNTGSCTWTTNYALTFLSGNAMSGSATAIEASVAPEGEVEVSVSLTAPSTTGTYTGYWRMANASGSAFGISIYVEIVVSDSAGTLTPTITETPTSTTASSTNTPTSTSAATSASTTVASATSTKNATSTPTAVPTATPAPAYTPVPTSTPVPTTIPTLTNTPVPADTPSS